MIRYIFILTNALDQPVCEKLTDLAILELATLPGLYRLSMAGQIGRAHV